MTDPRLTPDPALTTKKVAARIAVPFTDLCRRANGPRDRQLLLGAPVTVLGGGQGWSYVQSVRDGYCGYLKTVSLGRETAPTHHVIARATHAYMRANIKSRNRMRLHLGARIAAFAEHSEFIETIYGFIPRQHVAEVAQIASDPAAIAELFLGTPYLWGGNSSDGIDCSGLVQAACHACNIPCPGDSDMQQNRLGDHLALDSPLVRNDLLFWKGHVALVVDETRLIHANAFAMAVSIEPITDTIDRIAADGGGPVTAKRRLPLTGAV